MVQIIIKRKKRGFLYVFFASFFKVSYYLSLKNKQKITAKIFFPPFKFFSRKIVWGKRLVRKHFVGKSFMRKRFVNV